MGWKGCFKRKAERIAYGAPKHRIRPPKPASTTLGTRTPSKPKSVPAFLAAPGPSSLQIGGILRFLSLRRMDDALASVLVVWAGIGGASGPSVECEREWSRECLSSYIVERKSRCHGFSHTHTPRM